MKKKRLAGQQAFAPVLERNILTLLNKRREADEKSSWTDKTAVAVTRFTGSMTFVFLHLAIYGAWILANTIGVPGIREFDPTLVILAMTASVEAIFLSTFILITQNRMMAQADRRADLNLQISLLAEHEITRLITMTRAIARRMDVKEAELPDLEELSRDVAPEEVLERIEEHEDRIQGT